MKLFPHFESVLLRRAALEVSALKKIKWTFHICEFRLKCIIKKKKIVFTLCTKFEKSSSNPSLLLFLCGAAMLFILYMLCMFALYSFMPVVVKRTSATAVNLSLLTADLFSLFCGLFLFRYTVG